MNHQKWGTGPLLPKISRVIAFSLLLWAGTGGSLSLAQAQPPTAAAPGLAVGDAVPQTTVTQVLQAPSRTVKLSDYQGKLLILDFWATWCKPCIPSLQKLDTLQRKFKGQLAVLAVTEEPEAKALALLQKRGISLPSAVGNTNLKALFPHQALPHQVWIKDGRVLAITGGASATEANIRKVLAGQPLALRAGATVLLDKSLPLFVNGNGGSGENLLYQSVLSGRLNTSTSGMSRAGGNRILVYNVSLAYLFYEAFSHVLPFDARNNRLLWEVPDTLRRRLVGEGLTKKMTGDAVRDQPLADWLQQNTYCYSLTLPRKRPATELNARMAQDLNGYFGLQLGVQGSLQRRKVPCLALVRTGGKDLLQAKGDSSFLRTREERLHLRDRKFSLLVGYLTAGLTQHPLPLYDATGYQGNIDISLSLPISPAQLPRLRQELQHYGLDLREETREMEMLVLSYSKP
jgi:thiol-disulfide isomerase/thioredoxin